MSTPLISIIVPIYNVEKYLPRCIKSIINQTYSNIEVLLIDDGSTDNSLSICKEFSIMDKRVKVLEKENGGQATARNLGLDYSNGEYIGFVDGDDWIEPNMYQDLICCLMNNDAEVVQCGWYVVDSNELKRNTIDINKNKIYTSDEALVELIVSPGKQLNTSVCCKLFKSSVAKKFRFTPVRAYEDDEYIFKTVSAASRVVCSTNPLYNYFSRDGSTMTSSFNINKIALVSIQTNICNLLKTRLPEWYDVSEKILCSKQFYILHCLIINPQIDKEGKEAHKLEKSLMSSYKMYMKNPKMGKNKLMLLIIKFMPKFIWRKILEMKFSNISC